VVLGTRTQGLTVAVDPEGWLVKLKLTVPVGGLLVPLAVSVTVTVQPSRSEEHTSELQSRVELVGRVVLVTVSLPAEAVCSADAVLLALLVYLPAVSAIPTRRSSDLVVLGTRTQGLTVAVDPEGWLVKLKLTVPVGGLLVPLAVSVTVTVQPS